MRIDKFTSKLQSGLADAQSMAIGKDQNQLAPEHLIMALLGPAGWVSETPAGANRCGCYLFY